MLKTAKNWHDEIGYASTSQKLTKNRIDKIQQIQLNAMQHALELATDEICERCKKKIPVEKQSCTHPSRKGEFVLVHIYSEGKYRFEKSCAAQRILTLSKSLTTDKLNQ